MIINPKKIVEDGIIQNVDDGKFEVQQNGIDLTIKSLAQIEGGQLKRDGKTIKDYHEIEPDEDDLFWLMPGKAYSVEFEQKIEVPENMCAQIIQRSTLNRMGGFIIAGLYDSGFKNQIGAVLRTNAFISIEKGSRVAQIIFEDADAASQYNGQYQGE